MTWKFIVGGVDHYTIEARRSRDYYLLYALRHPPDNRRGSVNEHHLYSDGEICVTAGYKPRTIDRAKAIALAWCEGWSQYIRGYAFPNGAKRVNVNS